jgi:ribosomal protein S18 acetylase RimI-like enzyme
MNQKVQLRPARSEDYLFALGLYMELIRPYTIAFMKWVDEEQAARFAKLWWPEDTQIIAVDDCEVGWIEAVDEGAEIFLKQMYVAVSHQNQGIGSHVLRSFLDRWMEKPVKLGVLKNNPARCLYERLGFRVVAETEMKFLMRREPASG